MALTKISTDGVKDDAVTAGKIPANAVGSSELADNAVDTNAIQNDAVTADKLADSAVGTSNIVDGTVSLAKLPHGTSSNDGKFLRANNGADPSFETVSIPAGTTINNQGDNRVITGDANANTLNGESGLTFDGSHLILGSGKGIRTNYIRHADGSNTNTGNASQQYWKIGEISLNGSEGAVITLVGANGYSIGGTQYAAETTIVLRGSNASTLLGFWYSDSGSAIATYSDVRWKHISGTNYELWVSAGSYNNVAPVIVKTTGSFDNTNAAGTGSNNAPSGSTALPSNHCKQVGTIQTIEYQSTGTIFKRNVVMDNGYGIDFSATSGSGTSELFDDYEEGTFVITAGGGSNAIFGASDNAGTYTKIGRQVTIAGQFKVTGGNNALRIGLPFSASGNTDDSDMSFAASCIGYDYNAVYGSDADGIFIMVDIGQAYARFMEHRDNNPWADLLCDTNAYMRFTLTYFTA